MPTKEQLRSSILSSMDEMDELVSDIKSMIYGRSGSGKTVFGMQMLQRFTPTDKDIIFIDSHRGWVSLNNHPELKNRTKRLAFKGLSQIDALVDAINDNAPEFNNIGAIQVDEFSSIETHDLGIVQVGREETSGEFAQPTLPDMGVTTYRLRKSFSKLLKLPIHVVFISHLRDDEVKVGNKSTGKYTNRPSTMPKLTESIKGMMHELTYMEADIKALVGDEPKYTRLLQVMPTIQTDAKTRIAGLPVKVSPAKYLDAMSEWLVGSRNSVEAIPDNVESKSAAIIVD